MPRGNNHTLRALLTFLLLTLALACCQAGAATGASESRLYRSVADYADAAQRSLNSGAHITALQMAEQGLVIDPAYPPLLRIKAYSLMLLGRNREADRALKMAVAAASEDIPIQLHAFQNDCLLLGNEPEDLRDKLANRLNRMAPRFRNAFIGALFADRDLSDHKDTLLRALLASNALDAEEQDLARALVGRSADFTTVGLARQAVAGVSPQDIRAPALGAFAYLAGSALSASDEGMDSLLEAAVRLGFNPLRVAETRAGKYLEAGEAGKAATLYAEIWRSSAEPNKIAAQAAEAFLSARAYEQARNMLEQALAASPNEAFLQGRYLHTLLVGGDTARAKDYEDLLERHKAALGLHYGRWLHARRANAAQDKKRELSAMRLAIREYTRTHKHESSAYILRDIRHTVEEPDTIFRLYVENAWQAWAAGNNGGAFHYWKEAFDLNPAPARRLAPDVALALLAEGMGQEAVDILHKHAPDLPIATLSARLLRDGSWSALYAALPKAPLPPSLESWQALAQAQSAVYMGDKAQAERFARLWAQSSPPKAVVSERVYQDYRLEPVDFTPAGYQALLREYVDTLQDRGYTDILLEIAESPGLRALPIAPLAAVVSETGFALWEEGKTAEARAAWEKALRLDRRQPLAHLGMALSEKAVGNAEASRRHFEQGKGASLPQQLSVQARLHLMDGDQPAALAVYAQLVRHDPDNQEALYQLFEFYLEEKNYTAARKIRDRFALLAKNRAGGDQAAIFLAITEAGLGNHARAEALLRGTLRRSPGHVWATRQLVVTLREQGRHGEAEELLAASGVADPDPLGRLRRLAQRALAQGRPEAAEEHARRYLESNPHSGYMRLLYITALQEQGRLEEVKPHAQELLAGNEAFAGALRSLLRIAVLEEKELEASQLARAMAEHASHDPLARLEDAVHDPRHPLGLVESLAAKGPNAAYALWHFPGIARNSQDEYATLADIDHLLRKSAATHKTTPFSSLFAQEAPPKADDADAPAPIPTVLIFGAMEEARLREVDAMLVRREARAVLLVTEESFLPDGPDNSPRPEFLRRLALSGRWEFILTDTQRRRIVKDAAGRKVSFWDGPEWQGEAWESPDAMRARLLPVLRGIRQRALEAGFDLDAWMYPAGDHGQNKPEFTKAYREAYESAVDEVFDKTLVSTPLGYHVQDGPKKRIPVRLFYAAPKNEAIRAFGERHPTRQAALNEGMIAAWDRQMPRSLKTLRGAAPYGLSPVDMSFYQASSALNAGDTAQVARLSRDALALNPDAPRAQILRQRVEKRLRPDLFANYRTWQDDDKRRFTEIATGMEGHVSERLLLSVGASWLEWGRGSRNTAGQALGFGARWFTFDDHWLDASLRLVRPEEGNSAFLEGSFAWNGLLALDALRFNGAFTARYARESLESLESIEQDIYADHLSLSGDFRFLDRGLLIGSADLILRTDGNTTQRLMLRPGFLLCDEPIIELGYQLEIADSDRDPDAYYAPQGYQSHLATLRIEYALTPWLSLDGNVQYGRASTRDASDREVLRYGARAALTITDSLSLDMGYRKLKLPNYALDTATIGLRWEF